MTERDCLRCGTRIAGRDAVCGACGTAWPSVSMLDRPLDEAHADEAIVWVLGAMITLVGFFILFVAW
jgi:hypothetical protein